MSPADSGVTCLASGAAVHDGLDEDAQVVVALLGAVALDADPQAGRARLAQRDLEGHELPRAVGRQHQVLVVRLLPVREEDEEDEEERENKAPVSSVCVCVGFKAYVNPRAPAPLPKSFIKVIAALDV